MAVWNPSLVQDEDRINVDPKHQITCGPPAQPAQSNGRQAVPLFNTELTSNELTSWLGTANVAKRPVGRLINHSWASPVSQTIISRIQAHALSPRQEVLRP
jgi:hypothetical protein